MADHDALASSSAASTEMRRSVPMVKYRSLPLRMSLYAVSRLTRNASQNSERGTRDVLRAEFWWPF